MQALKERAQRAQEMLGDTAKLKEMAMSSLDTVKQQVQEVDVAKLVKAMKGSIGDRDFASGSASISMVPAASAGKEVLVLIITLQNRQNFQRADYHDPQLNEILLLAPKEKKRKNFDDEISRESKP